MHTFNVELNQLKSAIDTKLSEPYLERNIGNPAVDMDKVFFLNYIYRQTNLTQAAKEQYIITIMLIQIALDMHESMTSHTTTNQSETSLQLSVLAGDYYSANYYQVLSEVEDVAMIKTLANVIKETIEIKMNLYYHKELHLDDYIHLLGEVESLIFQAVAKDICDQATISVISKILLINKLQNELSLAQYNKPSQLKEFMLTHSIEINDVCTVIQAEVNRQIQVLENNLEKSPFLYSELKVFIENKYNLHYKTTIAEEG